VTGLLLLFVMFYAACGLVLSFVVNVVSFTTVQVGDNAFLTGLFFGIFPAFSWGTALSLALSAQHASG